MQNISDYMNKNSGVDTKIGVDFVFESLNVSALKVLDQSQDAYSKKILKEWRSGKSVSPFDIDGLMDSDVVVEELRIPLVNDYPDPDYSLFSDFFRKIGFRDDIEVMHKQAIIVAGSGAKAVVVGRIEQLQGAYAVSLLDVNEKILPSEQSFNFSGGKGKAIDLLSAIYADLGGVEITMIGFGVNLGDNRVGFDEVSIATAISELIGVQKSNVTVKLDKTSKTLSGSLDITVVLGDRSKFIMNKDGMEFEGRTLAEINNIERAAEFICTFIMDNHESWSNQFAKKSTKQDLHSRMFGN